METIDVVVIGAGPVGLTAAAFLTHYGIKCRIFDKKLGPTQTSNAVGVHARTLELFEEIGLANKILSSGLTVQRAQFFANKKPLLSLDLSLIQSSYNFVCDIPQNETERHLLDYLRQNDVNVEYSKEVIDFKQCEDYVQITVKKDRNLTDVIKAPWVIAADGYHSTFRENLHIPYQGKEFKYKFMMIDAPTEIEDPGLQKSLLLGSVNGITAMLFPMQASTRIIVETSHCTEYDDELVNAILFNSILAKIFPFTIRVGMPIWQSRFYVHERLAASYRKQRVFLVGDAAHVHIPAAAQGMNTGIQDAINLSWKLAQVIKKKTSETLLDTYESERRPIAKSVLAMTNNMGRMLLGQNFLLNLFRQAAAKMMRRKILQKKLGEKISQIAIGYSSNNAKQNLSGTLKAGKRFNAMPLKPLRDNYLILDFSGDLISQDIEKAPAEIYLISPEEKTKYFPSINSGYCVLRPDRYIDFVAKDKLALQNYLFSNKN